MAQSDFITKLTGNAVELEKAFQERGYPVAFVGSDVDKLHIFNVLTELKLARRIGPIPDHGSKEYKEAKAKDKEGLNPNRIKDKATKSVYEVDDMPSVIISITGDAADLPEDHELEEAVASLTVFCRDKKRENKLKTFVLSSEVAHRAILANYVYREEQITKNYIDLEEHKAKLESFKEVKSMLISYLLEIRIRELESRINDVNDEMRPKIRLLSKCFKYASVRDVLLDISKKLEENVSRLWSGDFDFSELKEEAQPNSASDRQVYIPEPISSGKRLSKSR
jgi:hypothetical protein